MKAIEAVRHVMKDQNISSTMLCERLGLKPNALSERFRQKSISVTKLHETVRVMNYKIVLMPSNVDTPKGGIIIE